MMKKFRKIILLIFLVFLVLGGVSCAQNSESHPRAWIDYPRDGDIFSLGEPITVISHAFAREGVAEVVLSVNGEAYRRDVPAEAGQDFVSLQQDWVPSEAGLYTLQVKAYDNQGQPGNPANIAIEIKGISPSPTPVGPTLVPPVSVTPVITATFVVTVTPVPIITVPPPIIISPTVPPPPPPDTSPPPAPSPAVPANGLELDCRSTQTLAWLPVSDPSGITGYYVKLEIESTPGNWQSAGGYGPVSGKQVNANVQCGGIYRWMVRAQDGAGNYSSWASPSYFSVNLG